MSLSSLPLSYCTNVHPGRTLAEVEAGLDRYTLPVQEQWGESLAAGLWLAQPVVRELLDTPDAAAAFAQRMADRNLTCHTLNAFPFGDFHSERVKENVYIPDWTTPERLRYTLDCARILATMLPRDVEGSISTVPLGFKQFPHDGDFRQRCIDQLLEVATGLARLEKETGRTVRLAIEPEPLCVLETTDEVISFFRELRKEARRAEILETAEKFLGVCYDVCHQSVEFENVATSIAALTYEKIRINKVHITCAIEIEDPDDRRAREALVKYVEPRYLHQTFARTTSGEILREVDLTEELATSPRIGFAHAELWRVHFHVPVNAERLGPLRTTRPDLRRALSAVAELDYAPHLEVETYTWEVLPDGESTSLVDGLTAELSATRQLLNEIERQP